MDDCLADRIHRILCHYPESLSQSSRPPMPVGGGFSGADIFRIESAGREYALRGWPRNSFPAARLRGLHRLLRQISEQSAAPVAVPLMSRDGDTLLEHDGRWWQVEPWLPGRADYWQRPNRERLRAAMRALAQWHRAAARFSARDSERDWFAVLPSAPSPAVSERLDQIALWSSARRQHLRQAIAARAADELTALAVGIISNFERAAPTVATELRLAGLQLYPLQPCLRDVWHDHVLFTGDDVTGLIDPSACRSESVVTDLARLLGSLVADDWPLWDVALEEYARHRPLNAEELQLVVTLDRSTVLLSGLTWLERLYLREPNAVPTEAIMQRLRIIAGRLKALAEGSASVTHSN